MLDGSGQGSISEYRSKQLGLHKGNINNSTGYPLPLKIQVIILAHDQKIMKDFEIEKNMIF